MSSGNRARGRQLLALSAMASAKTQMDPGRSPGPLASSLDLLDLELDVNTGWELQPLQRVNRLGVWFQDVDKPLVDPHLAVADTYRVGYFSSGQLFDGTCEGPDAGFSGRVVDLAGDGVGGVQLDVFSEGRIDWLGALVTGADGSYTVAIESGCYVVAFIAPLDTEFASGPFANRAVCAGNGDANDDVDALLLINGTLDAGQIAAAVTDRTGAGIDEFTIDLFESDETRARLGYLRSTTSDDGGGYTFTFASPGCVVLTFVAPAGERFVESGSGWLNQHVCVSDGQTVTEISATVDRGDDPQSATATGMVSDGGGVGVSGVKVDLFTANGDGSRGQFQRQLTTEANGDFAVTVDPGCWVLTYIAPDGETWADSNSPWLTSAFCVEAGQTATNLDAQFSA